MLNEGGSPIAVSPMSPTLPKAQWVRRFAYRAMLLKPSIDSMSAAMIAESQFEEACDLEPEDAAEIYTGRG